MTVSEASRAVIVVSAHAARGFAGGRAAVFALETLGFPVWSVPTLLAPWHPAHGAATRIVPPLDGFEGMLRDLARSPWLGEVGAVLSGTLGEAGQVAAVAALVESVKARNGGALFVCDPAFADAGPDGEGGLHADRAVAEAVRDQLLPLADLATPNRWELEWLTGVSLPDMRRLAEAALHAGPRMMLVSSAPTAQAGSTGNFLLTASEALLAEHRVIGDPPKGLGDLTAAVLLARLLDGLPAAKALQSATAAVFEILARTATRGADELTLETDRQSLVHPMAMVHLRHLPHPGENRRA